MGPEKRHRENGRRGEHRPCVLTMREPTVTKCIVWVTDEQCTPCPWIGTSRNGARGESVGSDLKAKPTHGSFVSSWSRGEFVHRPSALATTGAMPGDSIHCYRRKARFARMNNRSAICGDRSHVFRSTHYKRSSLGRLVPNASNQNEAN